MISLLLAMTIAHAAPTNAELKIGTTSEFDTLHPLVTNMSGSNYIISAALRTMVVFDINAKLIPSIAKKIPTLADKDAQTITENGVKKVAATFEILENAKWGDGVPVTCKDFALAVDVGHSKNVAISETEQFNHVERVEFDQKSPKKCRFIYTGSEFNFAETPKVKPLPEHLEGPIFQKYKNTPMAYEQNSLYVKEPTNPGLWNGPYKLTEVKVGSHVRLEPNPYFYGQKPQIKKIFIKLIPNSGTIEANLRSGTIDMVMVYVVNIDQALSMERLFKKDNLPYVFNYKDGFNYEHLDVNLDHPVLSSLVVRKALMHGIDREQISKSMFEGRQPVAHYST
ncbi:MAG TPA: ABC transporter substrate-binding protein, partial [Pseudobdellovibrionaceae bacterium]|nr:ABC transporter substrate-binding protein [Pseudobdellovibrionaceae bacterium]